MAYRTWTVGVMLGLMGVALASGCVVKSGDGDDDSGSAGEDSDSGSGGSNGGSGGSKGGTAGTNGGTAGTNGGTAGTDGGTAGTQGGSAGTMGGSSGSSGMPPNTDPECDPDVGSLDNTPYPDCEPTDPNDPDPCEVCIESSCCEESMTCYGYDPGNVCGWGGPDGDGEITCYVACAQAYVLENGAYDDGAIDLCTGMCATEMCGQIGNATQDLVVCIQDGCESECFGP